KKRVRSDCWWRKKPILGWAESFHGNSKTPDAFHAAAALAAFAYPSHIAIYAPGDVLSCCLAATRNLSDF
ncbi:TPA: hypothetical protein ACIIHG_003413, partial [Salmonella enterica subsp. enterica serovar Typhimurium]